MGRFKGCQEDKPCCESHYWAAWGDYSGSKTNCIVTVADLLNWVSPKEKKKWKLQKPRTKKLKCKRISKVIFPDIVLLNRSVYQKRGLSAFLSLYLLSVLCVIFHPSSFTCKSTIIRSIDTRVAAWVSIFNPHCTMQKAQVWQWSKFAVVPVCPMTALP